MEKEAYTRCLMETFAIEAECLREGAAAVDMDEFEKAVKLYKELNKKLSEAKMKIKKIEIDDLNLSKEIDYDVEDNDFETIDSFKDFSEAHDDDLDYDDDEY